MSLLFLNPACFLLCLHENLDNVYLCRSLLPTPPVLPRPDALHRRPLETVFAAALSRQVDT